MNKTKKGKKRIKIFWIIISIPAIFLFILFTIISTNSLKYFVDGPLAYMPKFEELENPKSNLSSEIFSADQKLLGKYYHQNRTVVSFDNLPQNLVDALIATEDIRFHSHSGIDPRGLGRVIFKTILMGDRGSGGGSTITQQLAKNLFPRTPRSSSKLANAASMVITKFKEWVIAVKLERNYTKEEIIAMYFNTVPFGSQAYGIKAAARTFFNTVPDSLNLEQAALLVGVVNAPTYYSPVRNPENSLNRRNNVVLAQMLKYGFIKQQIYDSIKKIPLDLNLNVQSHKSGKGTYFREYLRTLLAKKKPEKDNYSKWAYQNFKEDSAEWKDNPLFGWCNKNEKPNGKPYDIYQRYAEDAVKEHMGGYLQPLFFKTKKGRSRAPFDWRVSKKQIVRIYYLAMIRSERYRVLKNENVDSAAIMKNFKTPTKMRVFSWKGDIDTVMTPMDSIKYYKHFLHAGLMSIEPQTGYVRAYVGDINYRHFKFDNVMLARRQVGSTFKPIIYTGAMMPGRFSPCYKVSNVPVTFDMPKGQEPYTPKFSTGGHLSKYTGKMVTLKFGLAQSMNQISAKVLKLIGIKLVLELAKKMGIKSFIPDVPSICVGAAEIKLSEMVGAYTTFINKGVYVEPIFVTRIEDKNGNIISIFKPKKNQAISEGTAYRMIRLMQGVVDGGTSTRLRYKYKFKNEIAGKTGTTNDNSDGWFIGTVPNLLTGVWVGGEERSIRFASGAYGQGASMALPIWALYMQSVYANDKLGISKANFEAPKEDDGVETDCSKYNQKHKDDDSTSPDKDIY